MSKIERTFSLDAAGIDAITEALADFFTAKKVEKRVLLRARLTLEELLLRVRERDDAPETCTLVMGKSFGTIFATVRYGGAPFDPAGVEDAWSAQLLANLDLTPVWSYRGGVNVLSLRISGISGRSGLIRLLNALAAATALGLLGLVLPDAFCSAVTELLLTPMFKAFVGLLSTFAGLMILLTVASGVFGVGDARLLQRVGKAMFIRYLVFSTGCAAATVLAASRLFPLTAAPSSGEAQLAAISQLFFDILPSNMIVPFLDVNMMQIIALALFLGVVLLMMGERGSTIAHVVEEGSWLLQAMMEQVCRLIPLFVFVSLLRMFWSGGSRQLLDLWKPILLYLALLVCAVTVELVMTALLTKTPVGLLLRKILPQTTIAFTTASSIAAFETCVSSCEKKLGVDKHLVDFGVPIGSVVFMPSSAIGIALFAVYLAHFYGVSADPKWYVQACLLAAVLSIAAPPTAGAALTVNTVMLAQLGIPADGILIIATASAILDFFDTAANVAMRDLELVNLANGLCMLDRDTLRRA